MMIFDTVLSVMFLVSFALLLVQLPVLLWYAGLHMRTWLAPTWVRVLSNVTELFLIVTTFAFFINIFLNWILSP